MRSRRRTLVAGVALGALWTGVVVAVNASAWDSNPLNQAVVRNDHRCGRNDHAEPKLQGQVPKEDQASGQAKRGYNCGLELIGYNDLSKVVDRHGKVTDTRTNGNANMAWAGDCAYVAGGMASLFNPPVVTKAPNPGGPGTTGIAVVDVHNPAKPRVVRVLRMPGGVATSETIGARTRPDGKAILVVGMYGNDPVSYPKPMDIYLYDTRDADCSHLQHIPNPDDPANKASYYWPTNIHNLTVSKDGNFVFATIPPQAIDVSKLWADRFSPKAADAAHVRYVGNLNDALPGTAFSTGPQQDVVPEAGGQTHPEETSHEIWLTDDNRILYMGGQTPNGEILTIVDISRWLQDGKSAKVLSQTAGRAHSIRTATIGGVPYLLHSEESVFGLAYGCVPQIAAPFAGLAQPWLTNISDPTKPVLVSQMGLQINEPQNCVTQRNDGENDSVHYHDVDNPTDTHFVMASMWNAGIRVFDVRRPDRPTEVAYFNPADVAPKGQPTKLDHTWGHVHYDAARGYIWFASAVGGFYVVRIEDQVRAQLGLSQRVPAAPKAHLVAGKDAGWPGTRGITYRTPVAGYVDITPYYCTLGSLVPRTKPAG